MINTTPDITGYIMALILFIFVMIIFCIALWKFFEKIFKGIDYLASKEDERQKKIKEEKK